MSMCAFHPSIACWVWYANAPLQIQNITKSDLSINIIKIATKQPSAFKPPYQLAEPKKT